MTTSATGLCSKPAIRRLPAGFTLLEVLVVVLIIGIVLTFAVLAIGGDRRAEDLERESRQFAELLRLGSEQAVLRGEEWAVQIEPEEYRFLVYVKDAWQLLEADELFRPRELAEDTRLELELEGREVELETREEPKPTLILLSSGELSPFVAQFSADATEAVYRVEGDARGEIRWESAEE
jgi:general secretion pathway protein H